MREIQERYARRIKARLAQPSIDVQAARDGMLDCFVSTYHAGLAAGVKSILDIDAGEAQVARLARSLFRKRLEARGSSFEEPTVEALDAIKTEVDEELHFQELPAEMRGVHDQVCSLLLAKAEGTLGHAGATAVVTPQAGAERIAATRPTEARVPVGQSLATPHPAAAAAPRAPTVAPGSTVEQGLRETVALHLGEVRTAVAGGAALPVIRAQLEQLNVLLQALEHFSPVR